MKRNWVLRKLKRKRKALFKNLSLSPITWEYLLPLVYRKYISDCLVTSKGKNFTNKGLFSQKVKAYTKLSKDSAPCYRPHLKNSHRFQRVIRIWWRLSYHVYFPLLHQQACLFLYFIKINFHSSKIDGIVTIEEEEKNIIW